MGDAVLLRKREKQAQRDQPKERKTEGLHIDQNPLVKPVRECVQGMLPLLPVTPASGGLEVVPGSHMKAFRTRLAVIHPDLADLDLDEDFCLLREYGPCPEAEFYSELEQHAVLLSAEPGDLILWDSRTVHGGRVPDAEASVREDELSPSGCVEELARMSCTIAMTPRAFAMPRVIEAIRHGKVTSLVVPGVLDEKDRCVLLARRAGFEAGEAFNHCPHQESSDGTVSGGGLAFTRPALVEHQERLIDGTAGPMASP